MLEKSSDLPPKKKHRDQSTEQLPSPQLQQLLHELMNQLTIMNLCCFKFRAAALNNLDRSVSHEIDRIEVTVVELTSLLAKLPQAINASAANSSPAGVSRGNTKLSRSQSANVYPLSSRKGRSRDAKKIDRNASRRRTKRREPAGSLLLA